MTNYEWNGKGSRGSSRIIHEQNSPRGEETVGPFVRSESRKGRILEMNGLKTNSSTLTLDILSFARWA